MNMKDSRRMIMISSDRYNAVKYSSKEDLGGREIYRFQNSKRFGNINYKDNQKEILQN